MDIKAMMPNKESAVNLAWNLAAAAVGTALIAGASKKVAQIPATSLNALGAATVAGGIGASAGQFVSWAMTEDGEKESQESQMMRAALSALLAAAAIAPFSLDAVKKYVPAVDMSMNSAIALAGAVGTTVAAATYFFPALEDYTGDKAALEKLVADYKKAKVAYENEAQKLHGLEKAEKKDDAAIKASKELIEGKPAAPAKAAVGTESENNAEPEVPAVPGFKKEYETALKNAQDALNHKFGTEDLQKAAKALREEVAKNLQLVKKD